MKLCAGTLGMLAHKASQHEIWTLLLPVDRVLAFVALNSQLKHQFLLAGLSLLVSFGWQDVVTDRHNECAYRPSEFRFSGVFRRAVSQDI